MLSARVPLIIPTTQYKDNIMKEFDFKFDFSGEEHGFVDGETPDFELMTSARVEYSGTTCKGVLNKAKAELLTQYINMLLIDVDASSMFICEHAVINMLRYSKQTEFVIDINGEHDDVFCAMFLSNDTIKALVELSNPKKFGAKVYEYRVDFPTVKSLYWWLVDVLGLEEYISKKQTNEVYKKLAREASHKKFHIYVTKQAIPELACAIATASNSRSCMTRSNIGEAMYQFNYSFIDEDGDETGEWLHPFRAYENSDNLMVMFSELPPEKIEGKEWKTSPFFARAFADADLNISSFYGAVEKLGGTTSAFSLLKEYGFNRGNTYFSLRGYETSHGAIILPYVDQYYGDKNRLHRETHHTEFDGMGVYYEFTCDPNIEFNSDIYEVDHTDGCANEKVEQRYCPIYEEYYDEDEMTYIDEISEWVHNDFVDSRGKLDGVALFRHYNS